ncbi:MAG: HPr family phosphocarrier protein [Acidobacteria bacterium]|nr:HPr family phosphocarrier protein [Acidobacteriota bacterium]
MTHEVREATEFTFACPLPAGLHARPASLLSEVANRFASDCRLTNLRTGASANAKSVLALIAADVRAGDECAILLRGADEAEARDALRRFVGRELPACDEPSAEIVADARNAALPLSLRAAGVDFHQGLPASRGVGRGKAVIAGGVVLPREFDAETARDARHERARVERATAAVRARIGEMLARGASEAESAILKAHLAMLEDVSFAAKVEELIAGGGAAGRAVAEAGEFFTAVLRRSESAYIRERAADMEDICLQLLEEVCGTSFRTDAVKLTEPATLVAEALAPQQLLALDRSFLKALVLESAGTTSHTVILARSFNVPTLVGVRGATRLLARGREVIVDASRGFAISDPTPEVARFYERESKTLRRREAELTRRAASPATTTDGRVVEVAANVSSAEEARAALARGADGVGLFRTEMLFAGRDSAPTEDEQFETYARAAREAAGRTVIVRALDAGGDKPLSYLNLAHEANPFLGVRGVRAYAGREELLGAHLRAILRASAFGRVWLMIPMVSSLEEVVWFKARLAESCRSRSGSGSTRSARRRRRSRRSRKRFQNSRRARAKSCWLARRRAARSKRWKRCWRARSRAATISRCSIRNSSFSAAGRRARRRRSAS